jgi:hypothetical protein
MDIRWDSAHAGQICSRNILECPCPWNRSRCIQFCMTLTLGLY